jgi:peptidoglycan hydrolase-like protein with peptidoglycan-binding domain
MSGNDVKELQIRVAGWAADSTTQTYIALDGVFGSATESAVRRFQSAWGLTVDGIAGPQTQNQMYALESSDCSTSHFDYTEFDSPDCACFSGGKVSEATTKENVRRLMWKLEGVRRTVGDRAITITSGFRTISYNNSVGGASNSMHLYGIAADILVSGWTDTSGLNTTERYAGRAGFSGIIGPPDSGHLDHVHVDSRIEYPYGAQSWYWPTMWN